MISYRRGDGWALAGRLNDRLVEALGRDNVFMDVDSIDPGVDFVAAIDKAVSEADVLVAVIGPEWATLVDDSGRRRLDDPNDFVRLEVASALKREVTVVPVLAAGAEMPTEEQLPEELKPLTRRNAILTGSTHFEADVERLVDSIVGTPDLERRTRRWWLRGAALATAAGLVAVALWPEGVTVPTLHGLSTADAEQQLAHASLALGDVFAEATNAHPPGHVLWQSHEPGSHLEKGGSVRVKVAEPAPVTVRVTVDSIECTGIDSLEPGESNEFFGRVWIEALDGDGERVSPLSISEFVWSEADRFDAYENQPVSLDKTTSFRFPGPDGRVVVRAAIFEHDQLGDHDDLGERVKEVPFDRETDWPLFGILTGLQNEGDSARVFFTVQAE